MSPFILSLLWCPEQHNFGLSLKGTQTLSKSFISYPSLFYCCECYFFFQKEDFDSEDDKSPEENYMEMSKVIPQGTDKTPEVLDSALQGLSAR
jgi:hypothetical protein